MWFLHSRLSCKDPCWNGPNCEHSLEEKEGHLALATSTVATLRVAILGFPTQAISKLSRHGGWRRTWQMWHWPWNVKSTVRKARSSPTQAWIAWARVVATYNLAASLFCTAQSLSRTILDPASSPKVVTTSTVEILRVWFPRQAHLPLHGAWRRTRQICHWPWNVESKIEKAELPKNNTKLDCRAMSTADRNPSSTSFTCANLQAQLGRTIVVPWHPYQWHYWGSQGKQIGCYMVAGTELEKHATGHDMATGHEMSNQQS